MIGILLAIFGVVFIRHYYPEWPSYVQLMYAMQVMILTEVVSVNGNVKKIGRYLGAIDD